MKIRPVRAELFNGEGRIDGQTWWSKQLLLAILRTRQKWLSGFKQEGIKGVLWASVWQ